MGVCVLAPPELLVRIGRMNAASTEIANIAGMMDSLGREAVCAARALAQAPTRTKNDALKAAAAAIRAHRSAILAANRLDVQDAKDRNLSGALVDRLLLDEKRIESMAKGIEEIIALTDPIGTVTKMETRPNGLIIGRRTVPLGPGRGRQGCPTGRAWPALLG